jgi:prevent-host-death family protein
MGNDEAHESDAIASGCRFTGIDQLDPFHRAIRPKLPGSSMATHERLDPPVLRCRTMQIGVRDLRNRTAQIIDAVRAGERVTLSVNGEPVADIVPHGRRAPWLSGTHLREQLQTRAADGGLRDELEQIVGQTVDEL